MILKKWASGGANIISIVISDNHGDSKLNIIWQLKMTITNVCDRTLADWTSVDIYSDRNIVHNVTRSAPFKIHRSGAYFDQSCWELFQNSFFPWHFCLVGFENTLSSPFNENNAFTWKPITSRIFADAASVEYCSTFLRVSVCRPSGVTGVTSQFFSIV